jgi:cysteinyl-tRNA synthetase
MLLFYDLFARYLRYRGGRVSALVNITDVDPKIFARAREEGISPGELADRFIGELLKDCAALGIDGFSFARVSDHVDVAELLIKRMLDGGRAYSASGNIYLDTSRVAGMGSMSKMSRQEIEDCRLDIAPGKRSPSDILLWNASEQFDVSFGDRVLGRGIPWWHMQDTSVAYAAFGGKYDVHGGANELVYPHHESHLAQLRAATGKSEPVRLWTHTGLVYVKKEKMSKSLGNSVALRDLLRRHSANAIRLYVYSVHYRDRMDFAEHDIAQFEDLDGEVAGALAAGRNEKNREGEGKKQPLLLKNFIRHMEDDFDTPSALKDLRAAARLQDGNSLKRMVGILGLRYY